MNSLSDKKNKRLRQKQIMDFLANNERISIADIAKQFRVTTETARKDLKELEVNGSVRRYHGGAEIIHQSNFKEGSLLRLRLEENVAKKEQIAKAAAGLVHTGNAVLIDSGSTMYMLTQHLLALPNLVIITCSLPVATLTAANKIRTLMLGGEIFESDCSVGGPWVENCLYNLCADIAFIGASGIGNPMGPEVENFSAGNVKTAMLKHAKRKYIIADSSKFYSSSLISFSSWSSVDGVIVDRDIPPEFEKIIGGSTEIIYA